MIPSLAAGLINNFYSIFTYIFGEEKIETIFANILYFCEFTCHFGRDKLSKGQIGFRILSAGDNLFGYYELTGLGILVTGVS
jgi:hypothetical protein